MELNPRFQVNWVPLGSICQRPIGYAGISLKRQELSPALNTLIK